MASTNDMLHAMGKLVKQSACANKSESKHKPMDDERRLPENQNQPSLDVLQRCFPNMVSDNTPQK